MPRKVTLLNPEAPAPEPEALIEQRQLGRGGLRLGLLENSKGNADHLMAFLLDGIKAQTRIASVVSLVKPRATEPAPKEVLDQLAAEADFVITAMAD
jgi:hypothetical protein